MRDGGGGSEELCHAAAPAAAPGRDGAGPGAPPGARPLSGTPPLQ